MRQRLKEAQAKDPFCRSAFVGLAKELLPSTARRKLAFPDASAKGSLSAAVQTRATADTHDEGEGDAELEGAGTELPAPESNGIDRSRKRGKSGGGSGGISGTGPKGSALPQAVQSFHKLSESELNSCLLYTSPSPRDLSTSRMPSSA